MMVSFSFNIERIGLPLQALALCVVMTGRADVSATTCVPAADPSACSILLVHSYHPSMRWANLNSEHFRLTVSQSLPARIDTEFLDAKRRPSLEHAETFVRLLREKYGTRPPDVLVLSDDPAFDLIWPLRDTLFPGVPIVFMGLNQERTELIQAGNNVTGIYELHQTHKTVDLALALTRASGVIVVNDTSETGLANEPMIADMMRRHSEVEWVVERDLGVVDIQRLAELPDSWPIIPLLPLREAERTGPMLSHFESIARLRGALANPLFFDADMYIGSGLVGGYGLSPADHGRQAAELVLDILEGRSAETLPIRTETASRWVFDQRELDRFGWSHRLLPEEADIRFGEESFYARHRHAIYPLLAALLLALLVIIVLMALLKSRRLSEQQLINQKGRLAAALNASNAGVFEIGPQSHYASDRWRELTGASAAGDSGHLADWLDRATPGSREAFESAVRRLQEGGGTERLELEIESSSPKILDVLITREQDLAQQPGAIVGVATDVTTRRQYEEETARRNRFEILGELAGSVAHDFNNFLLVVQFGADMAEKVDDPEQLKAVIHDIKVAGLHTQDSLRQILSFGHHDDISEEEIDLNEAVGEIVPILEQMAGTHTCVKFSPSDRPLRVSLDRARLESILSNLVVNARDAMSHAGTIVITVGSDVVDSDVRAVLSVRDDGDGMTDDVRRRIFEPFYSTKSADQGTGLGLSTVYRVVHESGGDITVDSVPGLGTVFEMVWPLVCVDAASPTAAAEASCALDGKTILLVEEDPHVRASTQRLLEKAGSHALLAANAREGLELFSQRQEGVDLVLSDVGLPRKNGIDMISRMREISPTVKVGFLCGQISHNLPMEAGVPQDAQLLNKPFSPRELRSFVNRTIS